MKAAWQRLSLREQRLLLAMGVFLLAVVAFSLIWQRSSTHYNSRPPSRSAHAWPSW